MRLPPLNILIHMLGSLVFDAGRLKGKTILLSDKKEWLNPIKSGMLGKGAQITFAKIDSQKLSEYDLVIPLSLEELTYADSNRNDLPQQRLPIPRQSVIALLDNKSAFNEQLRKLGYENYLPKDYHQEDDLKLPYIAKPKHGSNSEGIYIIDSQQQHNETFKGLDFDRYLFQQVVRGNYEYACHLLVTNDEPSWSITIEYRYDKDDAIKGIQKDCNHKIVRKPFDPLFKRILNDVGFEGLCCINYKIIDGQPIILEINPRCGASLAPHLGRLITKLLNNTH